MPGKIFVVDDEQVIADSLCAILACSGFDARPFYDAETALAACDNQPPDFVISDVCMPGTNGVDMAMKIKSRFPACGILLFSGQASTLELLETARQSGHEFELLTKPVHPRDFLARLDTAMRRPATSDRSQLDSNAVAV